MKSKNLMLQVHIPEPILRFAGLAPGESHLGSGFNCKYQEIKGMCRLLDIHTEILKHISKKSSRNNNLLTRVRNQLLQSLEGRECTAFRLF